MSGNPETAGQGAPQLSVVGLNHQVAPVEVRERLAFDAESLPKALAEFRSATGSAEAVILSTCNRVELYAARDGESGDEREQAARWLAQHHGVPAKDIEGALYRHSGGDAVRHLFRVSCGLDAMVVGETEIVAQVKEAYRIAQYGGHTGRVLNPLFQRALYVAKRVRSAAGPVGRSVSIPSIAARLAEKVFQDLSRKRVLIVGAGETGERTLEAFSARGAGDPIVVNRTIENAERLTARYGGRALPLERLNEALAEADVVIACLAAPGFSISAEAAFAAVRARRGEPMVFIDLGVPRNVHPEVHRLENVYLFNIDDLEGLASQNRAEREREIARAEALVESEAREAMREVGESELDGLVVRVREALRAIGEEELRQSLGRMSPLTDAQREELERLVHRIVNKVLHGPTVAIRDAAGDAEAKARLIEAVARLFGLR